MPFVKAIIYADIFEYPLKKDEVWRFAIGKATKRDFTDFLISQPSPIQKIRGYYHLDRRELIIKKRIERNEASQKKLVLAKRVAGILAKISTIQFIGISGGLALLNADKEDDIDFFVITKKNTVWITRLLVVLVLEGLGKRRKRGNRQVSDRFCVNMYLDEGALALPKKWQDLFLAHEVAQVVPVVNKQGVYEKFIQANAWVGEFMPNVLESDGKRSSPHNQSDSWLVVALGIVMSSSLVEHIARLVQILYMQKHRTKEVISDTILAFHPVDYRGNTLNAYEKRLETL